MSSQRVEQGIPGIQTPDSRRGRLTLIEKPPVNVIGRLGMTLFIRASEYHRSPTVMAAEVALLSETYKDSAAHAKPNLSIYPLEEVKNACINDNQLIAETAKHPTIVAQDTKVPTGAYWTREGIEAKKAMDEDKIRMSAINVFKLAQRLIVLPRRELLKITSMYNEKTDSDGFVDEAGIRRVANLMLAGINQTESDEPAGKFVPKLVSQLGEGPARSEDRRDLDLPRGFSEHAEDFSAQVKVEANKPRPKVIFMADRRKKALELDNFGDGPYAA